MYPVSDSSTSACPVIATQSAHVIFSSSLCRLSLQVSAYAISWATAEFPWILLHTALFTFPFYFISGYNFQASAFVFFFLFNFLFYLWSSKSCANHTIMLCSMRRSCSHSSPNSVLLLLLYIGYFGIFVAAIASTPQVSQVLNGTMCILLISFTGFTRKPFNIPVYWKFLYWLVEQGKEKPDQ